METVDLQMIATRTRFMREAGIALILASCVLAFFLILPAPAPHYTNAVTIATTTAPDAYAAVAIEAKAAIVYDLATKQVLYAKNADAQLPLASLTKLLTVYTALKTLGPDAIITITQDATSVDAPRAFSSGQEFTLANLARLTLTGSLNDGAVALADAASAQAQLPTASLLASTAEGLGLAQTYALNGSGLDESTAVSGGYGSAHDVAVLAGALITTAPDIAAATIESTASAPALSGKIITTKNTDPNVPRLPRLLLSKTGYTDLAGGNFALVFDAAIAHPIAVVVLGSSKDARFTDADALVAATLAHFAGVTSL